VKEASVRVSKEEANILLDALEMYGGVHDAIVGGLGHRAMALMDKVIEAGLEAGWEEDASVSTVSTDGDDLNVSVRVETFAERTPPPSVDPFELPEEDDITGYLV
jgi:hypothetical protein